MLEETHDTEEPIGRVAAPDIGKAELVCCVRVPGARGSGKRAQEVRTSPTMTRSLLGMADRLGELGVTRVVMEATSDYVKDRGISLLSIIEIPHPVSIRMGGLATG